MVLRIGICDDDETDAEHVAAICREFFCSRNIPADVHVFFHPDEFIASSEKTVYQIVLLDMLMPMLSGLQLARDVRHTNPDLQIVFVTMEPGFALEAYAVNPLNYLVKPVSKNTLFATLELAARKLDYGKSRSVTVKTKEGLRSLECDRICYCEYSHHRVVYVLDTKEKIETTIITGNFHNHLRQLLEDPRFIQPHSAYAVNMSKVERLDNKGFFLLQNGGFVPISGRQFTSVRNFYLDFRLRKE